MNAPLMRLRLQHVTVRRNKDGTTRYYFRRRGQPIAPLPDDPLSPEFMAAYQQQVGQVVGQRWAHAGGLLDRRVGAA